LGRIFSQLGHYYPWMSLDHILDRMSLDQVFMYYDYMAEAVTGRRAGPEKELPDETSILKAHPELREKGVVSK
jgi:hypothetical protein